MRLLTVISAGLVVIAAFLLLAWTFQRSLIYFPFGDAPSPDALGLSGVESVSFETTDGVRLRGWFFTAADPRGAVLVLNGNAGNRSHRVPLAEALRRMGLQVLLFDYRGFGGNAGSPSERGLNEDARAARAYLSGRPDVDVSRLVYFGESLGTGVATRLAVEHAPAALILRSPFTSLAGVGRVHYPFLPVRWLLRDRFDVIGLVGRTTAPLLVMAGVSDRIVPFEQSRRVFEAAADPKILVTLPDADHNDYELLAGGKVIAALEAFFARVFPRASAGRS